MQERVDRDGLNVIMEGTKNHGGSLALYSLGYTMKKRIS